MQAYLGVYFSSAKQASQNFLKNWLAIPGLILSFLIFTFLAKIVSPLGLAGGFIMGFVLVILISLYYLWLAEGYRGSRLKFQEMFQVDWSLFSAVMSVAFLLWILNMLLSSLLVGPNARLFIVIAHLLVLILLNPLPEVIYYLRYESMTAVQHSFEFVKNYWIEWFLPLVVIVAPALLYYQPVDLFFLLGQSEILLPNTFVLQAWSVTLSGFGLSSLPAELLCLIIGHWFMLFRLELFVKLESGALRRKRKFDGWT